MCLLISVRVNVSVWQENECVSTVCDGFPSEIVSHAVFIKEGIVGDCPWLTGEREHSRHLFHRDVYQWITVGKVGSHTSTCSEVGLIFHVFVQSCQPLLTAFLHSPLNPALCEQGCPGVNNLLHNFDPNCVGELGKNGFSKSSSEAASLAVCVSRVEAAARKRPFV